MVNGESIKDTILKNAKKERLRIELMLMEEHFN